MNCFGHIWPKIKNVNIQILKTVKIDPNQKMNMHIINVLSLKKYHV